MYKTIIHKALLPALFLGATLQAQARTEEAVFAGGCFWCTESDFEKLDGVISAESGYTGGPEKNPTYRQVSSGRTRHIESVRVTYDPDKVSYETLLYTYWRSVDPTVANKQFCDSGPHYRTAIFYKGKEQEDAAKQSLKALQDSKRFPKIYTDLYALGDFWPAEEYHQDYYKKNPIRYNFYRSRCGRDNRLEQIWGKEAGTHKPTP
ncbi:peptide-methionine (S)-S-oxide reductase MsrA [Parendozoicomonas sp. Alg238-R29]|uniref:peptide-methionine (S)-S-oxide reductase MsrA n=1 Tax=Parendozoicomonas sp. Alg238-R29 TaxID=2993446 RepID=UPI00248EB51D|nr:peptide-methionine (S)-S-oxide reductase MsrA [Parendozoicomonas sp. Alg238-R29]